MDPALMAVAGQQLDANRQGIAPGHQPIAIMLDLMHPAWPGWRLFARGWQAGFDNGRQRHDIMAYWIMVQRQHQSLQPGNLQERDKLR
jgi:hypothetical protein